MKRELRNFVCAFGKAQTKSAVDHAHFITFITFFLFSLGHRSETVSFHYGFFFTFIPRMETEIYIWVLNVFYSIQQN